jgi:hypothetical protein
VIINTPRGDLKGYALSKSYQEPAYQQESNGVPDALEAYVREGARQMLATVLEGCVFKNDILQPKTWSSKVYTAA